MYRCRLDSYDSLQAAAVAREIAERLRAGEIGVLPTETVPGLVCLWQGPESVAALQRAKGRDAAQKCQFLMGSAGDALVMGVADEPAYRAVAAAFWPGPLTLILDAGDDTVGVRVPDQPWLLDLLDALGAPLVATSANPPGVDPAVSAAADYADLPQPPDFVVSGPAGGGLASTVCRLRPFEVLREGPVSIDALAAVIADADGGGA